MSDFFTSSEIKEVQKALSDVSGVGINITGYSSGDIQRRVFFDKAKLWRVIERIISVLYIKRLSTQQMFLHDADGEEYIVILRPKKKAL